MLNSFANFALGKSSLAIFFLYVTQLLMSCVLTAGWKYNEQIRQLQSLLSLRRVLRLMDVPAFFFSLLLSSGKWNLSEFKKHRTIDEFGWNVACLYLTITIVICIAFWNIVSLLFRAFYNEFSSQCPYLKGSNAKNVSFNRISTINADESAFVSSFIIKLKKFDRKFIM